MEIQVKCRNAERKEFIDSCARFFAKKLNICNSTYTVLIQSVYQLRQKRKSNGEVYRSGYRTIHMVLDSRLLMSQLLLTLAHEMVHVKQICRGQYSGKIARNGRLQAQWCGKVIKAKYEDRPWEIEAFGRQMGLVEDLIKYVAKKKNG